jgi:hypothetical protein
MKNEITSIFGDSIDVKKLFIPELFYDFLIDRLEWGLINSKEDGGFIATKRNSDSATVTGIYSAPDTYKELRHFHAGDIKNSEWFNELRKLLLSEKKSIGLYYHTHALLVDSHNFQLNHEEIKIENRLKDDLLGDQSDYGKSTRRIGDLIIEKDISGEIFFYGFAPKKYEPSRKGLRNPVYSLFIEKV